MKTKELMQFVFKSLVLMMIYVMSFSFCYSTTTDDIVPSEEDEWSQDEGNGQRNLSTTTFTIHLNNGILSIQNANPIYDLNITIINNVTGEEVYHTYISKEVSYYFTLPVSTLGSGEYCLTISNPVAGYVLAYFRL